MEELQTDKQLTHFDYMRDPYGINDINFPEKLNITSDEAKESQIINIVVPEGIRNTLDITVGKSNLRLCTKDNLHCFRTRVVMTNKKFPGFDSSSYQYVAYT